MWAIVKLKLGKSCRLGSLGLYMLEIEEMKTRSPAAGLRCKSAKQSFQCVQCFLVI